VTFGQLSRASSSSSRLPATIVSRTPPVMNGNALRVIRSGSTQGHRGQRPTPAGGPQRSLR
jgi:hypothetical protein